MTTKFNAVVFSDSHGYAANMRDVIARRSSADTDMLIYLGDGLRDFFKEAEKSGIAFEAVRGNCDAGVLTDVPPVKIIEAASMKLMITHGSMYGVGYDLDMLISNACRNDADIVMYGHTHVAQEQYIPAEKLHEYDVYRKKDLYILNPGSISLPKDGAPSFAVLSILNGAVLTSVSRL